MDRQMRKLIAATACRGTACRARTSLKRRDLGPRLAGPRLGRAAILIAVLFGSVEPIHGRSGQGEVIAAVRSENPVAPHRTALLQSDPPASDPATDEVTVTGTLVSADTGEPIVGGHIIILYPGISPTGYAEDPSNPEAVVADGESDLNGRFQAAPPVLREQSYGVIVIAPGYLGKVAQDKQFAGPDDPDVIDLGEIRMQSAT
jgi:hypothetical protein